jgi:hypothetical protein
MEDKGSVRDDEGVVERVQVTAKHEMREGASLICFHKARYQPEDADNFQFGVCRTSTPSRLLPVMIAAHYANITK